MKQQFIYLFFFFFRAAKAGHTTIVGKQQFSASSVFLSLFFSNFIEMLLVRGARINATNMGDDTALHLSAAHGHRDIVLKVRVEDYRDSFH